MMEENRYAKIYELDWIGCKEYNTSLSALLFFIVFAIKRVKIQEGKNGKGKS